MSKTVEEMSPRERDEEIARAKGWEYRDDTGRWWHPVLHRGRGSVRDPNAIGEYPKDLHPDYATPALAWELFRELWTARAIWIDSLGDLMMNDSTVGFDISGGKGTACAEAVKQAWISHDREKADE